MLPRIATLVAAEGESLDSPALMRNLAAIVGVHFGAWRWIEPNRVADLPLESAAENHAIMVQLAEALEGMRVDFAVQYEPLRRKKLLLADMDSTLIGQECIDELAACMPGPDIAAQVADITERAMRGELDFEDALQARLALLRGLPESALAGVWESRIRLNPGAETLMATMRHLGAQCVLVSGGFTYFADKVCAALQMHAAFANRLGMENGAMNGQALPPILGSAAKLQVLRAQTTTLGLGPAETMAVGDGANDLPMLEAAGLGVAYRAKNAVEKASCAHVRHGDLTALLSFQGISRAEWVVRKA